MTDANTIWAAKLREIAEAVKAWEARDVREQIERGDKTLSRPAYFADLEQMAIALDERILRVHPRKRGGQRGGVTLLEKRIAMAEAVMAYIDQHGGGIDNAAGELTMDTDQKGSETMRKAAQEFMPILRLPQPRRDFLLMLKGMEALSLGKMEKQKTGK